MGFKEKIIGILLIAIGAYPWLLKIGAVKNALGGYTFSPGGYLYQAIIVILGLLLIVRLKKQRADLDLRGK